MQLKVVIDFTSLFPTLPPLHSPSGRHYEIKVKTTKKITDLAMKQKL